MPGRHHLPPPPPPLPPCQDIVQMADLLLPSQGCLNCPCQAQQGHRQLLVLVVPLQMGQVITRLLCLIPAQPTNTGLMISCHCNVNEHAHCVATTSLCPMPTLVQRPHCDTQKHRLAALRPNCSCLDGTKAMTRVLLCDVIIPHKCIKYLTGRTPQTACRRFSRKHGC